MSDPRLTPCEADLARLGYRACSSGYLRLDLTAFGPPTVEPVGPGTYLVGFPAPGRLLPVGSARVLVTAAQLAHLVRLSKETT